ncbi:MAG: DUF429 domain-containing protein [Candidatus Geothermarchaeales archaeon]
MRETIVGLDLAGSEKRQTGVCLMTESLKCKTELLHTDDEIIGLIKSVKPDLVTIDAPLSLPKGRKSLEKREDVHFRQCDLELRKKGIRFFPLTLGPMRKLTRRGIHLKDKLTDLGLTVIEVYPGGAQDILSLPRQQHDLERLINGLAEMGLKGLRGDMTGHEAHAVTCALVGWLHLRGRSETLGDVEEGVMIMPAPPQGPAYR